MDLYKRTSFLDTQWAKIPVKQRQWHIDNNFYDFVYCKTCKVNKVNWSARSKEYSRFCSSKCAHLHPDVRKKTEQTCLLKYGETTNLKTHENKQKQTQTLLARYGVDNYWKSQQFRKNFVKMSLERYGVDNPAKSQAVKERADKTNFERYGRKRHSQIHINNDIIDKKNDRDYMLYLYNELKMPVSEIANQLGISASQLCVHFKTNLDIGVSRHAVSWPEKQLYEFVKQYFPDVIQSDRKLIAPKEIDILIPEKKLAIEYNGLAWHGELRGAKHRTYHLDKQKAVEEKGYQLIHIFSNEWNQKQEIVKSRLQNSFGASKRIPARKTQICQVGKNESNRFLTDNHIQGHCFHSVSYGLYYDNQLTSLMTFGKSRFDKKIEWELLRFTNTIGVSVQGGASKLFKYFLKTHSPTSIVSYCDLRWNTGKLYENLGFKFVKNSTPNYWYVSENKHLESRLKYQKHKLHNILGVFDPHKTEWENMSNNGFDRVWDCGNSVWHWYSGE